MVKKRLVVYALLALFLLWNVATYLILGHRLPSLKRMAGISPESLQDRIKVIEGKIHDQVKENRRLLDFLSETAGNKGNQKVVQSPSVAPPVKPNLSSLQNYPTDVIAVLVISCNRPDAVKNHVDQLLRLRPSKERFPILVSQDCNHEATRLAIQSYNSSLTYMQQPDQSEFVLPAKQKKFAGYYKIARHYRWALNQTFYQHKFRSVIVVEDDLDLSPDFFEYFVATYPLLRLDPTVWCVSAWNDNGKTGMIENNPELLYRTDFFPGLGWMLTRELWDELEPKWPETFWDDWMRRPEQRKDRICLRPEISRTGMSKFGKVGTSKGLYFMKHLQHIQLNSVFVKFTQKDLSYLIKDNYDPAFVKSVYSCPSITYEELMANKLSSGQPLPKGVRLTYTTKDVFKNTAKQLKLMEDFKAGVMRTAYRGVVPFFYNNVRVYLAPPPEWTAYDLTWN